MVAAAFDVHPKAIRVRLLALRHLILDTAAATPGVGPLQETLKWGQPAYLTPQTKSGSTIRIDRAGKTGDQVALYVHCQTNLVSMFQELYPDTFIYQGNRAILLGEDDPTTIKPLRHCLALALTHHLRKRSRSSWMVGVSLAVRAGSKP